MAEVSKSYLISKPEHKIQAFEKLSFLLEFWGNDEDFIYLDATNVGLVIGDCLISLSCFHCSQPVVRLQV